MIKWFLAALIALAPMTAAALDVMPGLMTGLQPDKYATNVLRLYPGMAYSADGLHRVVNSTRYDIDMLGPNGCGGLDIGSPASGKQYNVYILRNTTDPTEFCAVLSNAKFAGPGGSPPDYLTYPSADYVFVRKLQFGFVWSTLWDGIPDFHVSHWPSPSVRLTQAGYGSPWMPVYGAQTFGAWQDVDLSGYMPDNARMAYVGVEARYVDGSAGSVYVRSWSGQTVPLLTGSASPGSPFPGVTTLRIRVDSLLKIQVQTTGNARAYIQFLGYEMTEPAF
jgi:hypothetical protein